MGFLFLATLLVTLHGGSADTGTPAGADATCEDRLEIVKTQLAKAHAAPIELEATPGAASWPASPHAYVPPLAQYFKELITWLKTTDKQWAVALAAFVFGLLNVVDGPASFKTSLILAGALMAAVSAQYEAQLIWPGLLVPQQLFIAGEAALVAAFIVYSSIQGVTTVLGFMLGLVVSFLIDPLIHTELWKMDYSIAYYAVWGAAGVLSLSYFQKYTLAFLTPCLGSFLISSSLGYFVALVAWASKHQAAEQHNMNTVPAWLEIRGDNWLQFAGALLGGDAPAGIFPIAQTPGFLVPHVDVDRALGRFLWFLLFYLSAQRQWNNATFAKRKRSEQQRIQRNLRESLLQAEREEVLKAQTAAAIKAKAEAEAKKASTARPAATAKSPAKPPPESNSGSVSRGR